MFIAVAEPEINRVAAPVAKDPSLRFSFYSFLIDAEKRNPC